ncbi:MAG: deoxyhypusine synthase [Candidatus Saganbacteria bacterium]|uniref:Deoxyhypusine synthase n=1 Tax=Candidatus Saganbacteria bacterium TaxID=2575572 RepID=A0A833L045_UNCSA|nr:MAG: deoxyhypusine synthase [Candidatus Saganbacteria bacterium]
MVWKQMLNEKKLTIWLGISGAIVPAGMRRAVAYLIKNRMVDVVVSTGAQVFHDIAESLGILHYRGSAYVDDKALLDEGIDRFYDVLVQEDLQRKVDREIQKFIEELEPDYQYSSREFFALLGKYLEEKAVDKESIIIEAYKANVPVFAPALCDSSIGYSFVMARRGIRDKKDGKGFEATGKATYRYIDQMKDTDETVQIAESSKKSGVIYLGGGVPKNFIQQTELLNLILGNALPGHEYAIQITTDNPHFGGLSGCTFAEAQSWGKISKQAKMAQCFCDVTIALPILAHGLAEYESIAHKRPKPNFNWKGSHLKINYE